MKAECYMGLFMWPPILLPPNTKTMVHALKERFQAYS